MSARRRRATLPRPLRRSRTATSREQPRCSRRWGSAGRGACAEATSRAGIATPVATCSRRIRCRRSSTPAVSPYSSLEVVLHAVAVPLLGRDRRPVGRRARTGRQTELAEATRATNPWRRAEPGRRPGRCAAAAWTAVDRTRSSQERRRGRPRLDEQVPHRHRDAEHRSGVAVSSVTSARASVGRECVRSGRGTRRCGPAAGGTAGAPSRSCSPVVRRPAAGPSAAPGPRARSRRAPRGPR